MSFMLSYDIIIIINNYIINNLSFTDRFQGRGFALIFSLFTNHLQDILTYLFSFLNICNFSCLQTAPLSCGTPET
jgi:hypothetical protein